MKRIAPIAIGLPIVAMALTACDSAVDSALSPLFATTTVSATVTQMAGSPTPQSVQAVAATHEWTGGPQGTGLFAVGSAPRDGLVAIPQGRYETRVASGADAGDWMLCDTALCGPAFPENATTVGHAVAPYSSAIYLGPKARALWVDHLVLSPAAAPSMTISVPAASDSASESGRKAQ